MTPSTHLPDRSEVALEETWALESIFATPAEWEAACQTLQDLLPELSAYQGHLGDGPQVLLAAIEKLEEVGTLLGKLTTYASNAAAVNTFDQAANARAGQARSLSAQAGAAMAFFDPELMAIGFDTLRAWLKETPELAFFAHYVDRLEKRIVREVRDDDRQRPRQEDIGDIEKRIAQLNQRIDAGLRDRSLGPVRARSLRADVKKIEDQAARLKKDGRISRQEKDRLNEALDRLWQDLEKEKSAGRKRWK